MRVATAVLLSLIIAFNIVLFILSVLQANSPNAGAAFHSSVQEHWAFNIDNSSACDSYPFVPVRYMFQSNAENDPRYEYCSWKSRDTWWRSVSMVFLTIGALILLPILAKKSPANDSAAIWQDPKNVLRGLLIPAGAMGLDMFLLMCFDAAAVNQSQGWCNDLAASSADPVNCDYTSFTLTVIFDFLLFVFWGLVVLFTFLRQLKRFRPYQQLDDESDSHEMLDRSESGWRKKGGKSWIDKHLKKAKDKLKGRK